MSNAKVDDGKTTDRWIAAALSFLLTGISSLPYQSIFIGPQSLQSYLAMFFLPGLFVSTVLSGNVHGGSLEVGAFFDLVLYFFVAYGILRFANRRRKGNHNGSK